ncbi:peptidoglycan-binding protein [Phycicoccus sp.]|uniref:peptidoglycan-binding protein n=1 Tax=Phycicoccus sp. TaxID=1902410 RepID=UPI002C6FC82B|nr:peptidoglycan-binding protein [Phycicoccus sp.]HMM95390.1 peptidoglycan-binding protein [Phycicoccus sp.]
MNGWVGMTATKRITVGNGGMEAATPATTRPAKRPAAAAAPAKKPPPQHGGNSQENAFEGMHARDENGKFTSGADRNRGPQEGDKSRKVQAMQTLLTRLGYGDLAADGSYGPLTAAAVKRAQENHGITGETGFGPKLRAALAKEYASIGGDAAFSKGKGGRRSGGGSGKRGSGTRGKGAAKKKTGSGSSSAAAKKPKVHDPSNLADGKLTPEDGRYDKKWPSEWGKEPPKYGPKGARRAEGFKDGSAIYENGWVWDPDTRKFRLIGQNAYEPAPQPKKPTTTRKKDSMTTTIEFKRSGMVHSGREHKGLPVVTGVKVLSEDEGIVEAIVSVTGIPDEVKDVILPGAYAKTLAKRTPKGVFSHDWDKPVARTLDIKELLPGDADLPKTTSRGEPWPAEAGALAVKTQFNLATQQGREAYENVVFFGDEQEWSIGYNVPRGGARIDQRKGLRYINNLDLYEYSPVLFGAMPMAGTRGQKDLGDGTIEVKALAGSYEDLTERLRTAIDQIVNGGVAATDDRKWVWIRATMPDSVVVRIESRESGPSTEYDEFQLYPYKLVDGELVIGQPTTVRLTESITPMIDKDTDGDEVIAVTETKAAPADTDGDPAEDPTDTEDPDADPEDEPDDDGDEPAFISRAELDEMKALRSDS